MDKGDFVGRDALAARGAPTRTLTCLTMDRPESVVLGKEPVFLDGQAAGYVTSAAFGHTIGKPIAYAWLPAGLEPGRAVEVEYFGQRLAATVAAEPLVDPEMARIRR
jgi:glycine cleavage system aminomethyltransferase T